MIIYAVNIILTDNDRVISYRIFNPMVNRLLLYKLKMQN